MWGENPKKILMSTAPSPSFLFEQGEVVATVNTDWRNDCQTLSDMFNKGGRLVSAEMWNCPSSDVQQ